MAHETNNCAFLIWDWEMCWTYILWIMNQYMHSSKKFENFVSFLNYITNKSDAANTLYKIYDKNSIIECELIVYDLDYTYCITW